MNGPHMFDSRSDGFLLLRHDNYEENPGGPGWDLPSRGMLIGAKVVGRVLPVNRKSRSALGKWMVEDDPLDSFGDLNCATHWRANTREISGWAFAWPSAVTKTKSGGGGPTTPGNGGSQAQPGATQQGNVFGGGLLGDGQSWLNPGGASATGGVFGGGLSGTGTTIGLGGGFGTWQMPPNTPSPNHPTNLVGERVAGGPSGETGRAGVAGPSGNTVALPPGRGNTVARGGESGPTMVLPLNTMKLDTRFASKQPASYRDEDKRLWPLFPERYMGITIADVKESKQQDVFCPTDPRLFAAHKYDSDMGTLVCGITDKGGIDADRAAKLQSAFKVIKKPDAGKLPYGPNPFIALNMGQSMLLDSIGGAVVDGGDVGFINQKYGGPFHPGGTGCQHQIDKSDGDTIYSCHLSTNALFIMPADMSKDGPFDFEKEQYPSDVSSGDKKMKVHLVWDPSSNHDHITGQKIGKWKWYAESAFSDGGDGPCIPPQVPGGRDGAGGPPTGMTGIDRTNDASNVGDIGASAMPGNHGGPNPAAGRGAGVGGSTGQATNLPTEPVDPDWWQRVPGQTQSGPDGTGGYSPETWWLGGIPIVGEPTAEQVAAAGFGPAPGGVSDPDNALDELGTRAVRPTGDNFPSDQPEIASGGQRTVETDRDVQSPGNVTTARTIAPGGQGTPGGANTVVTPTPAVSSSQGYGRQTNSGNTSASPPGPNPPGGTPVYTIRPCSGVTRTGTCDGGLATMPPEVRTVATLSRSVISTDLDRPTFTNGMLCSVSYQVACPGTNWAAGIPDLLTGGVSSGYSWRVRNGALVFSYHDSAAAKAEQIKFDNTGDLCFKSNTSYWACLHHVNTADRTYTFPDLDTSAPRFVTVNQFTDGLGYDGNIPFIANDGSLMENDNFWFDTAASTMFLTGLLDITGDTIGLRMQKTIVNSDDSGTEGDICWDSDYIYICVSADNWKRAELLQPSGW